MSNEPPHGYRLQTKILRFMFQCPSNIINSGVAIAIKTIPTIVSAASWCHESICLARL
jgi:hypothetical protein